MKNTAVSQDLTNRSGLTYQPGVGGGRDPSVHPRFFLKETDDFGLCAIIRRTPLFPVTFPGMPPQYAEEASRWLDTHAVQHGEGR